MSDTAPVTKRGRKPLDPSLKLSGAEAYHRTSVAIAKNLGDKVEPFLNRLQVRSMGALITILLRDEDAAVAALTPLIDRMNPDVLRRQAIEDRRAQIAARQRALRNADEMTATALAGLEFRG